MIKIIVWPIVLQKKCFSVWLSFYLSYLFDPGLHWGTAHSVIGQPITANIENTLPFWHRTLSNIWTSTKED